MSPRLILPRDLLGANVIEVDGIEVVRTGPSDPAPVGPAQDSAVVLVVPSFAVLLQAGWLKDLRAQGQQSFSQWWAHASDDDPEATGWRYDLVASSWAGVVGPDRVHLIVGEDPVEAASSLGGVMAGATLAREPWLRSLRAAEVRMLEELVDELLALGMVGRNAADLVHGAAAALRRTPATAAVSLAPLDRAGSESARHHAGEMEARVDSLGIQVHGDRSALRWPAEQDVPPEVVPLEDSLTMTVGMLERVTTWGRDGERAE